MSGTTGIVDHHESPNAIEGSLDVIAEACAEVGVAVVCAYGVTDRHGADGAPPRAGRERALRPRRRARDGRRARRVHVHRRHAGGRRGIGRRPRRRRARARRRGPARRRRRRPAGRPRSATIGCSCTACCSIATAGHDRPQPAQQHEQRRRYARPGARPNAVVLGTDGIGADMLEELRLAYVAHRADDVTASPDTAWAWLLAGHRLVPEAADDRVRGATTAPTTRGEWRSPPGCGRSRW